MRPARALSVTAAILTLAWAGSVLGTPSTISYQGRLTTSGGTPVADGSYAVTFTIWTDSVAGNLVWSELQDVQVSGGGGLFSCDLGKLQPLGGALLIHGDDDLYMQTAVSGEALLPRLRLGAAVRAFSSSRVHSTVPGTGSVDMGVGDDTTKVSASHEGFSTLIDSYVHLTEDRGLIGLKAYDPALTYSNGDRVVVTADDATHHLDHDGDGDGIAEFSVWEKVDNTEALSLVGVDVDEDGVPDVGSSLSSKIPRTVLKTFFQTGDKPTQSRMVDSVDETGAYHSTLRFNGTDFEGHHVTLMPESALVSTEVSNPDVSSSSRLRVRVNDLETKLQTIGILARSSVTNSLTPTTCGVAINTKGTGADKNRTIGSTCDDSSAIQVFEVDDDGDGFAEAKAAVSSVSSLSGGGGGAASAAYARMSADSDDDGIPENDATMIVTPTTSSVAINSKGTGADPNRVVGQTSGQDAELLVEAAGKNIGIYVKEVSGQANITMTDKTLGTVDTTIIIDGAAKRIGIGVAEPTNPIEHSSGAKLTAGGIWSNASDANLKENFQPVDGEELLEKLSALDITRWTYKGDPEIEHIGPTAQDFQQAFGVGSDGKTISTIDPSGIALAVIKELNRKNKELQAQNRQLQEQSDDLQKRMDQLARSVEKLAASR